MTVIKRPGVLTLLIAVVLGAAAVAARMGLAVPLVSGHEFWVLAAAHALLVLGCTTRRL